MSRAELLALAERVERNNGTELENDAVQAMRTRIFDGCGLQVPTSTATFALAVALRALAERMTDA